MHPAARPKFLSFARIRFPVGAVASIGHRISGLVLAASVPFGVFALQQSLSDEGDLTFFQDSTLTRAVLVLLAWACAHHLFAGIRHLLTDVGVGSALPAARRSAYAALIAGGAVALFALLA